MRFSVIAAAVMATAVSAGEAVYYSTTSTTDIVTITSCGPEVTNCPGKTYTSTLANSTSYPVYANTSAPVTTSSYVPVPTYPVYPVSSPVSLATSYITTCVPTVITKVYTVTPTPVVASTGYMTYPHNATTPYATSTPSSYATGAASSVERSIVLAAAAGVAAFVFA